MKMPIALIDWAAITATAVADFMAMDLNVTQKTEERPLKSPNHQHIKNRRQTYQDWLLKPFCAINAPSMLIAIRAFAYAETDGGVTELNVLTLAQTTQFGILIDAS